MPYDYDAIISLFDSGVYNSQRASADDLVNAYYTNHLEPGSEIAELAKRVEKQLNVLSKLSRHLQTMKDAKKFLPKIEAENDLWEESRKDEDAAREEVRKAEAERKALDDRLEDIKKERNDLEKQRSDPQRAADIDQIGARIDELDNEKNNDIPYLKEEADKIVRQKQEILQAASTRKDSAHREVTSSRNDFRKIIEVDLAGYGIASNDFPGQFEIAEQGMDFYLKAAQDSFKSLSADMILLLQTMPHTDPNYNRLAGTIEYWMAVSTAFSGIFVYTEKQQESRQIIGSLKELRRIQNLDALNGNAPDEPQNENRPPVEGEFCSQTKEKLKEIRDYRVAPENAAAECARLAEEEQRLMKSLNISANDALMAKYPYLKKGPIEKIAELLYVPSRERGTGLFETEEEYRQRFSNERTEAAALLMMDEERITTPGFKDFVKEMMMLDMEEPGKGQREFEKQYQQKGFSVIHQNVNGVNREIRVDPKKIIEIIKRREPSKTELDNDARTSVEKDTAELKLFNNRKEAVEGYLNLHTIRLKKAAIVEKYPDAAKQPLYQNAEKRQLNEGTLQSRLAFIRMTMDQGIAQSTLWDSREYKNFYNALKDAIEGRGDLTNLKNMAETYIAAKGENPRSTYGKIRLSCAKLVKGYLKCAAEFTEESENLSKSGEQGLDDLGKMPFEQFLTLRQAREEMDTLLSNPNAQLSDQQKDKAIKNVMLLLNDKMKKQPIKDAPTEAQIRKSIFPDEKNITINQLKQALQKTPEQLKDACKEVVSNENSLERMRIFACYKLRQPKATPEEVRDAIAKLLVTAIAENKPGQAPALKELDAQSKQLQREPEFKNFCTDEKLQSLRKEALRHTDPRAAAASLMQSIALSKNPDRSVQTDQPQTERTTQLENQAPLDTVAITKQNAARAQAIRNTRRLAREDLGGGHVVQQRVGSGTMKKLELSVAWFDQLSNYQQISQIPANRLEDGKFNGYIAIGDPLTDALNSHEDRGRPKFVSRFIKGTCEASDEWYQDAYDNIMDIYYKNMTGNAEADRTAFYSDFRDAYLVHKNGGIGEMIGDGGDLTAGGGTVLHDLLNGIHDYGVQVKKTCTMLGREVPKTRGELEDLQKTLIEKKFENLTRGKVIRPEYGQAINDMLNDPECTLDRRNFLISVDVPTLQKLSRENASVEQFKKEFDNAENEYYNDIEKKLTEGMAKGDDYSTFSQRSNNLPGSRPSISSGIRFNVRQSAMSGRSSVRQSVMPGAGGGSRQTALPTIREDEPKENEKKSEVPQLGR